MDIKKALINHKSILTIVILAAMFLINILSGGNDYYMSVIVFILIYIGPVKIYAQICLQAPAE